jgi:hypothetical protein
MYGWKTCCYTEVVKCRESATLLRFALYISELVSCLMSALDFLILKLLHCSTLVALPFVLQSLATFTSRCRPAPFSLIKKCRRVPVLLSERQCGSWNSGSSCKKQLVSLMFPNNYVIPCLHYSCSVPAACSRGRKIAKTTSRYVLSASLHATTRLTLVGFSLMSDTNDGYLT